MRITGGTLKGRRLSCPKGQSVRPTSDRVREALFQTALVRFGQPEPGASVLDLFCGSGALGLEALSRGAAFVCFVDSSARSLNAAVQNAAALGVQGQTAAVRFDLSKKKRALEQFFTSLKGRFGPFHMVLMDPPYGKGLIEPVCRAAAACGILAPEGVLVMERPAKEEPVEKFHENLRQQGGDSALCLAHERGYGQTRVLFYTPCSGEGAARPTLAGPEMSKGDRS